MIGTATTALVLITGAALAQTQEAPASPQGQMMGAGQDAGTPMRDPGPGMTGGRGMMARPGMMGDGPARGGMRPHMMLMMMALVDTDASGTLSLEEVQAVHARMFQYADTDEDGELTIAELRAFMHGGDTSAAQ
jgi:hypothetical protein